MGCRSLHFLGVESVVLVVYHPDRESDGGEDSDEAADDAVAAADGESSAAPRAAAAAARHEGLCDFGSGFFDAVLEVSGGALLPPSPCERPRGR